MRGAREHNLQERRRHLPRDKLVVITGLSGSGKTSSPSTPSTPRASAATSRASPPTPASSSGQMEKPDVDHIEGLSPAIAIEQKAAARTRGRPSARSPRSTTTCASCSRASATPHCPKCGREIERQTVSQIVDQVMALPEGTRLLVLARLSRPQDEGTASSRRAQAGLRPRPHRRRRVRPRGAHARQEQAPHDRGRRGPSSSAARRPRRTGRGTTWAARSTRRPAWPCRTPTQRVSPTPSRRACAWARAS